MRRSPLLLFTTLLLSIPVIAEGQNHNERILSDPFRQLNELLPTPNEQHLASGAPGPGYWQQRADYEIDVEIDTDSHRLIGQEFQKILLLPLPEP